MLTTSTPLKRPGSNHKQVNRTETDTSRELLRIAVDIIDTEGESALRVTEVAQRAGHTVALIYQYFGNREGLVEAARLEQFKRMREADTDFVLKTLSNSASLSDLLAGLEEMARIIAGTSRQQARWSRLDALGSSRRRPHLAQLLGEYQHSLTNRLVEGLSQAQAVGLLRTDIHCPTLATFLQGLTMGRFVGDLDPANVDTEAWVRLAMTFIHSLLSPAAQQTLLDERRVKDAATGTA